MFEPKCDLSLRRSVGIWHSVEAGADVIVVAVLCNARSKRAAAVKTQHERFEDRGLARAIRTPDQDDRPSCIRLEVEMLPVREEPEVLKLERLEDHAFASSRAISATMSASLRHSWVSTA